MHELKLASKSKISGYVPLKNTENQVTGQPQGGRPPVGVKGEPRIFFGEILSSFFLLSKF